MAEGTRPGIGLHRFQIVAAPIAPAPGSEFLRVVGHSHTLSV